MIERSHLPIYLASFTIAVGYAFIYSLMSVIRNDFGISESGVGAIGAIGFAAGFLSMVTLSRYADRGHMKTMLRIGITLVLCGNAGMIFASDLAAFLGSRAALGLGAGMFAPAVRRLIVLSEPSRAGERLGMMSAFDMTGFLAGPALATFLYELGGLHLAFAALTALVALVSLPILRSSVDEAPTTGTPKNAERPIRLLLELAPIRGLLLLTIGLYTTIGVFEAIWSIFLDDLGGSQRYIGFTLTLFALPMIIFPIYAGRLAQRIGPLRVAVFSIAATVPLMALYGTLTSLSSLAILCVVHGTADAFTSPSIQLGIAQASPERHLASGQGLVGAIGQAVAAITALGSGTVYQFWGAGVLFSGSAAITLLLLFAGVWQGRSLLRPSTLYGTQVGSDREAG